MVLSVLSESVLNRIAGLFLHAEGHMIGQAFRLSVAETELPGLLADLADLLQRMNVRLHAVLRRGAQSLPQKQEGVLLPGPSPGFCPDRHAGPHQRQRLAAKEVKPHAADSQEAAEHEGACSRKDQAFQNTVNLRQLFPVRRLIEKLQRIVRRAEDHPCGKEPKPLHCERMAFSAAFQENPYQHR